MDVNRITFQRERAQDVFQEMLPLLEKHWEEIAHFKDILLEPDTETYFRMEDMGILRVFTARDENGILIGYNVFFIKHNLHYKSSLNALQDILFIHPDYRKGTIGTRLIKWCDEELRAEGVQVVYQHLKAKKELDFSALLERIGYHFVDKIYARRLDGGK